MNLRIATTLVLGSALLAGCKQEAAKEAPQPATVQPTPASTMPDIATTTFAPDLKIDLAAMTKHPSGLYTRDLTVGTGAVADTAHSALVHYVGALPNGSVFDSSGPNDPPLEFRPGAKRVIDGWEEGVVGMRVGGRRQLIIPPDLGYGPSGRGPIPPNGIMVFTIDLVAVK